MSEKEQSRLGLLLLHVAQMKSHLQYIETALLQMNQEMMQGPEIPMVVDTQPVEQTPVAASVAQGRLEKRKSDQVEEEAVAAKPKKMRFTTDENAELELLYTKYKDRKEQFLVEAAEMFPLATKRQLTSKFSYLSSSRVIGTPAKKPEDGVSPASKGAEDATKSPAKKTKSPKGSRKSSVKSTDEKPSKALGRPRKNKD